MLPETVEVKGKSYTLTTIGRAAFAGFSNIDEIILPQTITTIEDYAFFGSSIKEMTIPNSVTSIGDRAFGKCKKFIFLRMPRDIQLGKDLYAESKCEVSYTVDAVHDVASAKLQKLQENDKPTYSGISDVDQNIPINPSDNESVGFAIIIANENYKTESAVQFALQDGRSFRDYCSKTLGLPADHIRYRENATLNNIVEDFGWMKNVAEAFDGEARFIVYYAGHGVPDESNGAAYLLPVDGSGTNVKTGYSLDELYKQFGKLNAENVTLFLDACFSGSLRGDGMLASARGVAIKAKTSAPTGNLIVFTAAQGDETAYPYDDMGHGMFTYFLLKKLKDSNGKATIGEIGDYVTKQVKRKSIVANGKQQTPSLSVSTSLGDKWKSMKLK